MGFAYEKTEVSSVIEIQGRYKPMKRKVKGTNIRWPLKEMKEEEKRTLKRTKDKDVRKGDTQNIK